MSHLHQDKLKDLPKKISAASSSLSNPPHLPQLLQSVIKERDDRLLFNALRKLKFPEPLDSFNYSQLSNQVQDHVCLVKDEYKRESDVAYKELQQACNRTKTSYLLKDEGYNTLLKLLKFIIIKNIRSLEQLMSFFPEITEKFENAISKPRIFEALWKIIFLLQLDNLPSLSNYIDRNFYTSLQKLTHESVADYLNHNIDDGSASGSADLLFSVGNVKRQEKKSPCEIDYIPLSDQPIHHIIVTSKYYKSEKGIDKYDIDKLVREGLTTFGSNGNKPNFTIMVWVKDKTSFLKRLVKSELSNYIPSEFVLDVSDLNQAFLRLCDYLYQTNRNHQRIITPETIEDYVFLHYNKDYAKIKEEYYLSQIALNESQQLKDLLKQEEKVKKFLNESEKLETMKYELDTRFEQLRLQEIKASESKAEQDKYIFMYNAFNKSHTEVLIQEEKTKSLKKEKEKYDALDKALKDSIIYKKFNQIDDSKREIEEKIKFKPSLELRFHQEYIVRYTDQQFDKGIRKLMWGAVPRSGKSYMVGGLVSRIKPKIVLLILGAISETKDQFISELFLKYRNFDMYQIIDIKELDEATRVKNLEDVIQQDKPCIIVCSQEKLREEIHIYLKGARPYRVNTKKTRKSKSDSKLIDALEPLLDMEPMIFFDEVHQGGGNVNSNNMQEQMLNHFYYNEKTKTRRKNPYICFVTATYLKPTLKYGFDLPKYDRKRGPELKLITWSYESNNILMKSFDTIDDISTLIEDDVDKTEKVKVLTDILTDWSEKGISSQSIANTYERYPELYMFVPKKQDNSSIEQGYLEVDKLFRIEKGDGFRHNTYVKDALTWIYENVYNPLYKDYNVTPDGTGSFHSQLWFLPTNINYEKNVTEFKEVEEEDEDEVEDEHNSPFEEMSRGLAEEIIKHEKFKNFNVAIVHSITPPDDTFVDNRLITKDLKDPREPTRILSKVFLCNSHNVKKQLTQAEILSAKDGKSLIILTGKRLRLGVSLTCVDIALHLDPIETVDTIYQSMFRVLTERAGKKRGIFVDLLPQRAIKFIYQIGEYTGIKSTKREDIIHNLFLFNVNKTRQLVLDPTRNGLDKYNQVLELFNVDSDKNFVEKHEQINMESINDLEKQFVHHLLEDIQSNEHFKSAVSHFYKKGNGASTVEKQEHEFKPGEPAKKPKRDKQKDISDKEKDISDEEKLKQIFTKIKFILSLYCLLSPNSSLNDFYESYDKTYSEKDLELCEEKTIQACYLFQLLRKDKPDVKIEDLHKTMQNYNNLFQVIEQKMSLETLYINIQRRLSTEQLSLLLQSEFNMDWDSYMDEDVIPLLLIPSSDAEEKHELPIVKQKLTKNLNKREVTEILEKKGISYGKRDTLEKLCQRLNFIFKDKKCFEPPEYKSAEAEAEAEAEVEKKQGTRKHSRHKYKKYYTRMNRKKKHHSRKIRIIKRSKTKRMNS